MYPNNPQNYQPNNQDYSVDYLNQISQGVQVHNKPNPKFLIIIIAVVIIVVGLFIAMAVSASKASGGNTEKAPLLFTQMNGLKDISTKYHDSIRDTDLRAANSSYTLLLTDALRDIEKPLASTGLDMKKLQSDKTLQAEQKSFVSKMDGELNEAKLLVLLDRNYAREMAFQIRNITTLMTSLKKSANTTSMTEYVDNRVPNFNEIEKTFANYADSK